MLRLSEFAKEDTTKSWQILIEAISLLILLETAIILLDNIVVDLFLSLTLSLLFVRLFSIYHDTLHRAIFTKSKLARFIIKTFGVLVLNPPSVWERSHNYHHKHNSKVNLSSIGSFPILSVEKYDTLSNKEQTLYKLFRHPLNIIFGYFTVFLLGMCIIPFLKSPAKHIDALITIIIHVVLTVFLLWLSPTFFFFGLWLPLFVSSMIGAYLFYVQHNFPNVKILPPKNWDYFHSALHSTSYFKMNEMMAWFTGNIGYHHIHHLNAQIPFYNLPKAMHSIAELQNPTSIRWSFEDVRNCFALYYWDGKTQEMISEVKN